MSHWIRWPRQGRPAPRQDAIIGERRHPCSGRDDAGEIERICRRQRHVVAARLLAANRTHGRDGIGQRVLLAAHAGDETATTDLSLGFHAPEHAQQRVPGRQPVGFAFQQAAEHHAIAPQQDFRHLFQRRGFVRHLAPANQAPASRVFQAEQRDAPAARRELALLVAGDQQRTQPAETVGVHQPRGHQLAQRGFRLRA
jgi:hypothetical protein